jgi:hypothetical protein
MKISDVDIVMHSTEELVGQVGGRQVSRRRWYLRVSPKRVRPANAMRSANSTRLTVPLVVGSVPGVVAATEVSTTGE